MKNSIKLNILIILFIFSNLFYSCNESYSNKNGNNLQDISINEETESEEESKTDRNESKSEVENETTANVFIKIDFENFCEEIFPFIVKIQDLLQEEEGEYAILDYTEINDYLNNLPGDKLIYDSLIVINECTGEEVRKKCYEYRIEYGSFYNIYARNFSITTCLPPFKNIDERVSKEKVREILGTPFATCQQVFEYHSDIEEDESYLGFRWNVYIIFENDVVKAFLFSPNFNDC